MSMKCDLKIAKLRPCAILPTKEDGNAGFDLYACLEEENTTGWTLMPHQTTIIPTGLIYSCDNDWQLVLKERGSTAFISMKIGAGVGDSNYRGELKVFLYNGLDKPIVITPTGDKIKEEFDVIYYPISKAIAQFLILPVPKTTIIESSIDDILNTPSSRGNGMLGSSGK